MSIDTILPPTPQLLLQQSTALIRTLCERTDVHFQRDALFLEDGFLPLFAPHLAFIQSPLDEDMENAENESTSLEGGDWARALKSPAAKLAYRSYADCIACRLQYCDEALHLSLCPQDNLERLVFEMLEQLRVESLVDDSLHGIKANIAYRFDAWCDAFFYEKMADSSIGILLFTLALVCHSRLNITEVWEKYLDYIEATRDGLASRIGHDLKALKTHRADQAAYAIHAKNIARLIRDMIEAEVAALGSKFQEDGSHIKSKSDKPRQSKMGLLLNFSLNKHPLFPTADSGISKRLAAGKNQYAVFDKTHDVQNDIQELMREAVLMRFRQELDKKLAQHPMNCRTLSNLARRLFNHTQPNGWEFAREAGYIDPGRLHALATNNERRVFQQFAEQSKAHAVVSFLVDCSGSMRGKRLEIAQLLDLLLRSLHLADVPTELLGFTTRYWNGGSLLDKWQRDGSPADPGRLNATQHITFKTSEQHYRKSRPAIAGLLRQEIYKESIDGEAVTWAVNRLLQTDYQHKYLVVVSDGCPMDSATNQANDVYYLDNHLRQVLGKSAGIPGLSILGLGVGLDMSPFYRHNTVLDLNQPLSQQTLTQLLKKIAASRR